MNTRIKIKHLKQEIARLKNEPVKIVYERDTRPIRRYAAAIALDYRESDLPGVDGYIRHSLSAQLCDALVKNIKYEIIPKPDLGVITYNATIDVLEEVGSNDA